MAYPALPLLLDACRNAYQLTGAPGSAAGATGHEWMQLEQVHLLRHVHLGGQGVSPEAPREDRGGTDRDLCHEHAHQAHLPGRWRCNDPSSQEVKGFFAPQPPQMQTTIHALGVRQTADLCAVPRIHQVERHTAAHQQARNTKAPAGIYPPARKISSGYLPPVLQRHLLDPSSLQVSCYCLPRNVKDKSVEELRELRELGLKEVYIGCESGDNEVGSNAHLRA
jgi:hypothetical protein